jgi:putative aldouronate transport system substrate-binding protein
LNPLGKLRVVPPFSAGGKAKPAYWTGPGYFGFVLLKKASADRLKEVLGVLNYFAAPFGSAEHLLINYGIENVHCHLDDNGNPSLTDQGKAQNTNYWTFIQQPPQVPFNPNDKDCARVLEGDEKAELAVAIAGTVLSQTFYDAVSDIIFGRRPFSDCESVVADWRSSGGDQICAEYHAAIASR